MCLYTKQICPLRARKDIVCYKKFYVWHSSLETIYKFYRIVKPEKDRPTLMDDTNFRSCVFQSAWRRSKGVRYEIWGGMIHAFRTKPALRTDECRFPRTGIYKCIIPKGTLYYVGIDNDICAKQMLVVEELNPNTAG